MRLTTEASNLAENAREDYAKIMRLENRWTLLFRKLTEHRKRLGETIAEIRALRKLARICAGGKK